MGLSTTHGAWDDAYCRGASVDVEEARRREERQEWH